MFVAADVEEVRAVSKLVDEMGGILGPKAHPEKRNSGGTLARRARAGHLFGPVPLQWPFRGCTKGAHLEQCSYLGVWLY